MQQQKIINVLGLFDGVSCGQLALKKSGIKYDNYYASEIDKHAIKVTQHNWPNTIQLGSVVDVKADSLPSIDLMIGGFCCQSFSLSGKQNNFSDPRGMLFFQLERLLSECKPRYFLFENVVMQKKYEDFISEKIGVSPVKINSALFSAQSRNRLYWTNIPVKEIFDKNIKVGSILDQKKEGILSEDGWRNNEKSKVEIQRQLKETLLNSKYKDSFSWSFDKDGRILVMRPDGLKIQRIGRVASEDNKSEIITCLTQPYVNDGEKIRKISPEEGERLQTIPVGYTSLISNSQRMKCLGNCWTVDVISHIFNSLKK